MRFHLFQLTFLTLFICTNSCSWAAILCVQSKETLKYSELNRNSDCVPPESLIRPTLRIAKESEQTTNLNKLSGFSEGSETRTVAPVPSVQWDLRVEDGSIYAALKRWSYLAGWQISWEIPVDFPIEIMDSSKGSFENSVRRILTAFKVADYPPYPCFHENKVVRVVRRIQGDDEECK